jgi:hypothetical protein
MLVADEETTSQLFAKHFDIIPLIIFQEVQTQIHKAIDVFRKFLGANLIKCHKSIVPNNLL